MRDMYRTGAIKKATSAFDIQYSDERKITVAAASSAVRSRTTLRTTSLVGCVRSGTAL